MREKEFTRKIKCNIYWIWILRSQNLPDFHELSVYTSLSCPSHQTYKCPLHCHFEAGLYKAFHTKTAQPIQYKGGTDKTIIYLLGIFLIERYLIISRVRKKHFEECWFPIRHRFVLMLHKVYLNSSPLSNC